METDAFLSTAGLHVYCSYLVRQHYGIPYTVWSEQNTSRRSRTPPCHHQYCHHWYQHQYHYQSDVTHSAVQKLLCRMTQKRIQCNYQVSQIIRETSHATELTNTDHIWLYDSELGWNIYSFLKSIFNLPINEQSYLPTCWHVDINRLFEIIPDSCVNKSHFFRLCVCVSYFLCDFLIIPIQFCRYTSSQSYNKCLRQNRENQKAHFSCCCWWRWWFWFPKQD